MKYFIKDIARVLDADGAIHENHWIDHLLIDSRKLEAPASGLFFAIRGPRRDGHQFIDELYRKGVRNFIVSEPVQTEKYPAANFLEVFDTVAALQLLVSWHRNQFSIPVIGLTGSNGKTIVKEWLYQLLHEDFKIVRSPKSYNSQIGVPLSVWQMNADHELAIFEAGISEPGEMIRLEKVIRPTLGILTNIGEAHSEGFNDADHKFREKLSFFRNCQVVIGRDVDFESRRDIVDLLGDNIRVLTWGEKGDFRILEIQKGQGSTGILLTRDNKEIRFTIPFTDEASIENAITCACVMLVLDRSPDTIAKRMKELHPVNMRLEMKKGINHCLLINDSYSADLSSLLIALNFMEQQATTSKKTVILSDFLQTAIPDEELYPHILDTLRQFQVSRVIAIGERIGNGLLATGSATEDITIENFPTTDDFIRQLRTSQFKDETILVKGARIFALEQVVQLLEQKSHQTLLEINLNAIAHNLKEYQRLLKPSTKVMAMVKAFAYGSGGAEIAGKLEYHAVDYLGVAYADEGVELRRAGISLPVMVMNPEEITFGTIVTHHLEPELYSFEILDAFDEYLRQEGIENYPVHIELETGMNRLGFSTADAEQLAAKINSSLSFRIQSVFSHLAGSEEAVHDEFTLEQFRKFEKASRDLEAKLGYPVLKHIANSAAIVRHLELQMDMVRLGIGLYGVDSSGTGKLNLQTVATLRSTIAQIKSLKKGESVSYNRKTIVERDSRIATIRIGYADGYPRRLGNGVGMVYLKGNRVPVSGTVCMDMIMVDVTDVPGVQEGDEVVIFGKELPVQKLAEMAGTIPYEIMTGISQRVKRIYYEE